MCIEQSKQNKAYGRCLAPNVWGRIAHTHCHYVRLMPLYVAINGLCLLSLLFSTPSQTQTDTMKATLVSLVRDSLLCTSVPVDSTNTDYDD